MAQHPPMKILLGSELWLPDLVATLVGMGHEVSVVDSTPDIIIGFDAWRIPPGTSQDEVLQHVGMILKQVRATKHVQNTSEEPTQVGVTKKSRKPVKRKRASKKGSTPSTKDTTEQGQPCSTGDDERPAEGC